MSKRPASPTSPTTKKARVAETLAQSKQNGAGDPQLSKGASWLIQQIDSMQKSYREALMAAVAILEYRKSARTLRLKGTSLPKQLNQKLERAWAGYEATRRHVEWYMTQNALYASTPSHPAIIMPTSQAPVAPPSVPDHLKNESAQNKASPIDLSSASMLAYDHSNLQATNGQNGNFGDGTLGFGADGNMNISSMDIGELSAIINGSDGLFGGAGQGDAQQNAQLNMFANTGSGDGTQGAAATPGTQAETDKLLASLGGMPQAQSNNAGGSGSADAQNGGGGGNDGDVDALLASLDSTAPGEAQNDTSSQDFIFDFGGGDGTTEVDLSELAGLFSDAEVASATAAMGANSGDGSSAQPAPAADPSASTSAQAPPATSTSQGQTAQKADGQQEQQTQPAQAPAPAPAPSASAESAPTTQPEPTQPAPAQPAPAQADAAQPDASASALPAQPPAQPDALDFQNMTDGFQMDTNNPDLGAIDLDEFNFGDNDMPNVDGDEFESLFAEFK